MVYICVALISWLLIKGARAMATYTTPIFLTGDMIGTMSGYTNNGNPGDTGFGINLQGVVAIGTSSDQYRLVWTQNVNTTDTVFKNGQGWTFQVYDALLDIDGDPTTGDDGWSNAPGFSTNVVPQVNVYNGSAGGDEYIVFGSGSNAILVDINGNLPTTPTDLLYELDGEDGVVGDGNDNGDFDFDEAYTAVCFAAGTLITTLDTPRAIETLKVGDVVMTRDNGPQMIRWIGGSKQSTKKLKANPNLHPICIKRNALGTDLPQEDLFLSPQHRVVVRSTIVERMFDCPEVLVAVKHLVGVPGISVAHEIKEVTYFHMLFDRHEIVWANGAESESMYLGEEALKSISKDARDEVFAIFPDILKIHAFAGAAAFVRAPQARKLSFRHIKNEKPLVAHVPDPNV
jgi:hypothetical protein